MERKFQNLLNYHSTTITVIKLKEHQKVFQLRKNIVFELWLKMKIKIKKFINLFLILPMSLLKLSKRILLLIHLSIFINIKKKLLATKTNLVCDSKNRNVTIIRNSLNLSYLNNEMNLPNSILN